jgi:tRNA(Ile)-lysidine synthase
MLADFSEYIRKQKLFPARARILLTVSGGVDSVVMCALFKQAGISFGIAHCNFQLRGKESEEDELFVEALAESYAVPYHSISFDTSSFAKKNKLSIQAAARQLRYAWFAELKTQFGYHSIATAHHRDDSIETFFVNLVRGTGISGLHGILPRQGDIIRPLSFCGKAEILAFAKANKLKYREDSSNASEKYVRNKIRLKLLPLLKELNPDIQNTLVETIQRLQETEEVFNNEIRDKRKKLVRRKKETVVIQLKALKELWPLTAYLFQLLKPYGFKGAALNGIINAFDGTSGKQFFSDTHRLIKDRKELIITPRSREKPGAPPEEKNTSAVLKVKKGQKEIVSGELKLTFKSSLSTPGFKVPASKKVAALDQDKIAFPLELRRWKEGDTFQPLGMKGKKKLSDYFTDRKFSIPRKENTWLLCSGENIIWIVGERIDDRFKIDLKTKKIFFVSVH